MLELAFWMFSAKPRFELLDCPVHVVLQILIVRMQFLNFVIDEVDKLVAVEQIVVFDGFSDISHFEENNEWMGGDDENVASEVEFFCLFMSRGSFMCFVRVCTN